MTGRRGRVVTRPDGSVRYQLRTEPDVSIEMLNITEKQRFMDGDKDIAIISEAASSGISLQADRRAIVSKYCFYIYYYCMLTMYGESFDYHFICYKYSQASNFDATDNFTKHILVWGKLAFMKI